MPAPGWYRDPDDANGERWWDGSGWTQERRRSDVAGRGASSLWDAATPGARASAPVAAPPPPPPVAASDALAEPASRAATLPPADGADGVASGPRGPGTRGGDGLPTTALQTGNQWGPDGLANAAGTCVTLRVLVFPPLRAGHLSPRSRAARGAGSHDARALRAALLRSRPSTS